MTFSKSRRQSLAEVDQLQCARDLAETETADSEAREQVTIKAKRSYVDAFPEELSTSNSNDEDVNDINSCHRDAANPAMDETKSKMHGLLSRIFNTQSPLSLAIVESGQPKGFVVNKQYMDQMARMYHENTILKAEISSIRKSLASSS